jgi:WD40 repeat protein
MIAAGAPPTADQVNPLPPGAIIRFRADSVPYSLISGLRYSHDGKAIFCVTGEDTLAVFDPKTGNLVHNLRGPTRITPYVDGPNGGPSLHLAAASGVFSPDGRSILCEGTDGSLMFFDSGTGRYLRSIKGPHPFSCFVQTPDGRSLITLDYGVPLKAAGLRIWDTNTCVEKKVLGYGYGTFTKFVCDDQIVVVNPWVTDGPSTGFEAYRIADGAKLWQNNEKGKRLYGWIGKNEIAIMDQKYIDYSVIDTNDGKIRPLVPANRAPTKIMTPGQVYESPFHALRDAGTLRVAEMWTYKELFRFDTAYSPFGATAVSPDGTRIAIDDHYAPGLHLFEVASRREITRPVGHLGPVNALAFTPDGGALISSGSDGLAFVWDVRTGAARHAVRVRDGQHAHHRTTSTPASVAASGLRICFPYDRNVSGATDTFEIWDLAAEARVKSFPLSASFPGHTLLSPDGKTLANRWFKPGASAADWSVADWTVRISDVATEKLLNSIDHRNNKSQRFDIGVFAFTTDGRLWFGPVCDQSLCDDAVREWDGTVTIWDPTIGQSLRRYRTPFGSATPAANGAVLVGGVVTSREISPGPIRANFEIHGEIVEVEIASGQERARFARRQGVRYHVMGSNRDSFGFTPFMPSPDGRLVAEVPAKSQTIVLWDAATGTELHQFAGPTAVTALAFAPDGRTLASGGADGTNLIWDVTAHLKPTIALAADEIERCWWALASADAAVAFQAMTKLAGDPAALARARGRMKPAIAVTNDDLAKWVRDLDSNQFPVRQRAATALGRAGRQAETVLREAANKGASAEVRQQATALLATATSANHSGEQLADVRAIELMEWWGTAEARAVLVELAKGAPAADSTQMAAAALKRLSDR